MASLLKDKNRKTGRPNDCRTLQFVAPDGSRRSIRLGKISQRDAESIKQKVESLIGSAFAKTSWDPETAEWVGKLDPKLHGKLSKAVLLPTRKEVARSTLAPFGDDFIAGRTNVKRETATVYGHTRRCLVKYFGANKSLSDITPADCEDWRRWLARPKDADDPKAGGRGLRTTRFAGDVVSLGSFSSLPSSGGYSP